VPGAGQIKSVGGIETAINFTQAQAARRNLADTSPGTTRYFKHFGDTLLRAAITGP
jgi:hypothetical protein